MDGPSSTPGTPRLDTRSSTATDATFKGHGVETTTTTTTIDTGRTTPRLIRKRTRIYKRTVVVEDKTNPRNAIIEAKLKDLQSKTGVKLALAITSLADDIILVRGRENRLEDETVRQIVKFVFSSLDDRHWQVRMDALYLLDTLRDKHYLDNPEFEDLDTKLTPKLSSEPHPKVKENFLKLIDNLNLLEESPYPSDKPSKKSSTTSVAETDRISELENKLKEAKELEEINLRLKKQLTKDQDKRVALFNKLEQLEKELAALKKLHERATAENELLQENNERLLEEGPTLTKEIQDRATEAAASKNPDNLARSELEQATFYLNYNMPTKAFRSANIGLGENSKNSTINLQLYEVQIQALLKLGDPEELVQKIAKEASIKYSKSTIEEDKKLLKEIRDLARLKEGEETLAEEALETPIIAVDEPEILEINVTHETEEKRKRATDCLKKAQTCLIKKDYSGALSAALSGKKIKCKDDTINTELYMVLIEATLKGNWPYSTPAQEYIDEVLAKYPKTPRLRKRIKDVKAKAERLVNATKALQEAKEALRTAAMLEKPIPTTQSREKYSDASRIAALVLNEPCDDEVINSQLYKVLIDASLKQNFRDNALTYARKAINSCPNGDPKILAEIEKILTDHGQQI